MEKPKKVGKRRSIATDAALVSYLLEQTVRKGGTRKAVAEMVHRLNIELGLSIDEQTVQHYVNEEISSRVVAHILPKPRGKS
jgi:hypothetical protein